MCTTPVTPLLILAAGSAFLIWISLVSTFVSGTSSAFVRFHVCEHANSGARVFAGGPVLLHGVASRPILPLLIFIGALTKATTSFSFPPTFVSSLLASLTGVPTPAARLRPSLRASAAFFGLEVFTASLFFRQPCPMRVFVVLLGLWFAPTCIMLRAILSGCEALSFTFASVSGVL